MQESHDEGLATHIGSESCVVTRKGGGEALTGGSAGRVLSRVKHAPSRERWAPRGADAVVGSGRLYLSRRHGEPRPNPVRSQTPCMHGHTSRGNREIPRLSAVVGAADRTGKSKDVRR